MTSILDVAREPVTIEELIRVAVREEIQVNLLPELGKLSLPKQWVSPDDAAVIMGVSRQTVDKWLKRGLLVRMDGDLIGRKVLISMDSVRRFGKRRSQL